MSVRLGAFELGDPLGQGAMGRVWAGRTRSGAPVAIKVITTETDRGAVHAEIRAASALDHPGVVAIFDRGTVDGEAAAALGVPRGAPWFAMERLASSIRDTRGLDARSVLVQLLDALGHAHAREVVHRDLKPSNVLVDDRGRIRLADFGLAHFVGQDAETPARAGSPAYMAPEQLRGEWRDFGPWTDLYALGCLACELYSGRPPFLGTATELIQGHLYARPDLPEVIEPSLGDWIRRCLAKDPHHRFHRASQAAAALSMGSAQVSLRSAAQETFEWTGAVPEPAAEPPHAHMPVGEARAIPARWPSLPATTGSTALGLWGLREVPLVGRAALRDALWGAFHDVTKLQRPAAVLLHGEAGTGKSRLARELTHAAHQHGCAWVLRARFSEVPGPDVGLAGMLLRDLQLRELAPEPRTRRVIRELEALGETDSDEQHAVEQLAIGSGEQMTPSERLSVVARHVVRRGTLGPVVVFLDDVQHGAEGLDLVDWLLERAERPVLVVATLRGDDPVVLDRFDQAGCTTLPVSPLSETEHRDLVERIGNLDPDAADQVARRTAGRPLFAVQLVGDWVHRGILISDGGKNRLAGDAQVPIPDSLHELWQRRLERAVRPADRPALEIAALLGEAFAPREWAGVVRTLELPDPEGLAGALADARLVIWDTGSGRWSFVHGMLRESIERSADLRIARWHSTIAEWLGDHDGAAQRIGRHLLLAGRPREALPQLVLASDRLQRLGRLAASADAVALGQRAILEGGVDELDPDAISLALCQARLHAFQGDYRRTIDTYERVLDRAVRAGDLSLEVQATGDLGECLIKGGAPEEGWELLERAVALAPGIGRRDADELQRWYGFRLASHGRFERARQVLEPMERRGAIGEIGLACVATWEERLADAEAHLDAAERNAGTNRRARATLASARADLALKREDYPGARAAFREVLRLNEAMGAGDLDLMEVNLALVDVLAGEYATARPLLLRTYDVLVEQDRRLDATFCLAGMLLCDVGEGRLPSPWTADVLRAAEDCGVGPDALLLLRAIAERTTDPELRRTVLKLERRLQEKVGNADLASEV